MELYLKENTFIGWIFNWFLISKDANFMLAGRKLNVVLVGGKNLCASRNSLFDYECMYSFYSYNMQISYNQSNRFPMQLVNQLCIMMH